MPLCPECRSTYPEGVVVCRDCRAALVDSLAELPDPEGEWLELVPLRPVPNSVSAAMWQGALESQGLHPVVRSHVLPAHGGVLHDWREKFWGMLLVPSDELDEARLVLDDFLATARERGPAVDDDADPD